MERVPISVLPTHPEDVPAPEDTYRVPMTKVEQRLRVFPIENRMGVVMKAGIGVWTWSQGWLLEYDGLA